MAINLTGNWGTLNILHSGNQVTATATVPNPHFQVGNGVLTGLSLPMTFTGGQHVQTHQGTVSSDGTSISWSNGTVWRKVHS